MRWCVKVAALGLVLAAGGCGGAGQSAGPATVPLAGKVVVTKGASVASLHSRACGVEFESVGEPKMRAYGAIQEDGSFTMATRVEESGKPGVVPGKHRVRLNLGDSGEHLLAPKFQSFDQSGITVTAPSEQPVEIKVWK